MILHRFSALASLPALNRIPVVSCTTHSPHADDIILPSAILMRPDFDATALARRCDSLLVSLPFFCAIFLDLRNYAKFFCTDIGQRFSDNELVVTCSGCSYWWLLNLGGDEQTRVAFLFAQENMRRNSGSLLMCRLFKKKKNSWLCRIFFILI